VRTPLILLVFIHQLLVSSFMHSFQMFWPFLSTTFFIVLISVIPSSFLILFCSELISFICQCTGIHSHVKSSYILHNIHTLFPWRIVGSNCYSTSNPCHSINNYVFYEKIHQRRRQMLFCLITSYRQQWYNFTPRLRNFAKFTAIELQLSAFQMPVWCGKVIT
jgi:hypothetical protein